MAHADPEPDDVLERLAVKVQEFSPSQLAIFERHLAPEDRQVIERIIAQKRGAGWRADPLTMGVHFGSIERYPHSQLLARKFREAVEGTNTRQLWSMPPQHGKSLIGSRFGPAWAFDLEPQIKIALTSYGDVLANENATFVRDFLVEHGDELRAQLRRDRRRNDRFVTEEGGGMIAAGVGSGLTGFGAHGVIVDDPFKNWETAHSVANRQSVWNWFRSVVLPRLNARVVNGERREPFVIVIQTRWHEEDLVGMLLADDEFAEWDQVVLPAIAEGGDLLGREPGEPLAPELHPLEELVRTQRNLGTYLFAGLYQQHPLPAEGGEIKRAWFQFSSTFPKLYDECVSSWDTKFKDRKTGDYVVGQAWGRTGASMWCYDQMRGQYSFVTTKTAICLMAVRHPEIRTHLVENTGNGPEIMTDLRAGMGPSYVIDGATRNELGIADAELSLVEKQMRRGLTGIIPVNVKEPKPVRVRRNLGTLEALNVHLPEGVAWTGVLVDESSAFPDPSSHDDCVDAMTQALDRLTHYGVVPPPRRPRRVHTPRPSVRSTHRR